ncbi:hypothetical protein ACP4OV_019489 [Aristida adscensionis]
MPAGSYLAMRRSFSYRKLKKLPTPAAPPPPIDATTAQVSTSVQDSYASYHRAVVGGGAPWRRRRRRRPRLRISGLARALRGVGGRVRASVAKVARRLREGRPYVGDLFAGNYMFLQVAPSPTVAGNDDRGFSAFAEYYSKLKSNPPAAPAPAPAGAALYKA